MGELEHYLELVAPEQDVEALKTLFRRRHEALINLVRRLRYGAEFVNALMKFSPPIRFKEVADELGISPSKVTSYVRKFRSAGVRFVPNCATAPLGLGRLMTMTKGNVGRVKDVPHRPWLVSVTDCVDSTLLIYTYPFKEGPEFIVDSLKRKYGDRVWWCVIHDEGARPALFIDRYLVGKRLMNPIDALRQALEHPTTLEPSLNMQEAPKDILDLFIYATLQINIFLRYVDIAKIMKERLKVVYPLRKVGTHVAHLRKSGAFWGTTILGITDATTVTGVRIVTGSKRVLRDLAKVLLRYPYLNQVYWRRDWDYVTALLRLDTAWGTRFRFALKEMFGIEELDHLFTTDIANVRARFTIPFRNFDPFKREWVREPAEIDKWLRERGYRVTGIPENMGAGSGSDA